MTKRKTRRQRGKALGQRLAIAEARVSRLSALALAKVAGPDMLHLGETVLRQLVYDTVSREAVEHLGAQMGSAIAEQLAELPPALVFQHRMLPKLALDASARFRVEEITAMTKEKVKVYEVSVPSFYRRFTLPL